MVHGPHGSCGCPIELNRLKRRFGVAHYRPLAYANKLTERPLRKNKYEGNGEYIPHEDESPRIIFKNSVKK
ncbi:MAG: hypothetical protein B1H12_04795 [Desulfobacteraceae bacterium 4484_190.2]|nr:MAG: hypothetical protein B1H12_04795 [Desulfobacteraceae bacterium 4484_190.2]